MEGNEVLTNGKRKKTSFMTSTDIAVIVTLEFNEKVKYSVGLCAQVTCIANLATANSEPSLQGEEIISYALYQALLSPE